MPLSATASSLSIALRRKGADVPLAILAWAYAMAWLLGIPVISAPPLLAVGASVWCLALGSRLSAALRDPQAWEAAYYRNHLALHLFLLLGLGSATLWMLIYYVPRFFLWYLAMALFPLLLAGVAHLMLPQRVELLFRYCALGFVAMAPAYYLGFQHLPVGLLLSGPAWACGVLFTLCVSLRDGVRCPEKKEEAILVNTIGCALLLLFTLAAQVGASDFDKSLYLTLACGAGCLLAASRFPALLCDGGWLILILPPLLGMAL